MTDKPALRKSLTLIDLAITEDVATIDCDLCDGMGKKSDGTYCIRCEGYGTIEVAR